MSLPYYAMYPEKYEAKAGWLNLAQDGAYNRLLRLCWMTPSCSLPNDHKWIQRRMKVSQDEYEENVIPVIDDFFVIKGGRITNEKLFKEYEKSKAKIDAARKNGRKGGKKSKSLKDNDLNLADAEANRKLNESYKEEDKDLELSFIYSSFTPAKLNPTTKTAKLVEQFLNADEISLQLEKFINHHTEKQTKSKDFNRQWRTWMQNQVQWKLEKGNTHDRRDYKPSTTDKIATNRDERRSLRSELLAEIEAERMAS